MLSFITRPIGVQSPFLLLAPNEWVLSIESAEHFNHALGERRAACVHTGGHSSGGGLLITVSGTGTSERRQIHAVCDWPIWRGAELLNSSRLHQWVNNFTCYSFLKRLI